MKESNIQSEIMLAMSRNDCRLFRANVGRAWTGNEVIKVTAGNRAIIRPEVGDVVIRKGRPLSTGLPVGFPDLFGWQTVRITEDMVGQEIAVFCAIEVKSEKGRVSEEQANILSVINKSGGRAGVARSADHAREIARKTRP